MTRLVCFLVLISNYLVDVSSEQNCFLRWNLLNNSLRFVCKLRNDKMSASLFDPNNNLRAKCNMHTRGMNCVSTSITDKVEFDADLRQVVMTIPHNKYQLNIDGKWICQQDNLSYTTTVNIAEGITFSTSLKMIVQMHRSNSQLKIGLTCQSCREPYGNTAEFQIGGRTVAHIRYDRRTKTCFLRREACNGTSCNCSHNGNMFFLRMETFNESIYSCSMLFVDKTNRVRFQKTATLLFDGKEFHRSDTKTEIIKGAKSKKLLTTTDLVTIEPKQEESTNVFKDYLVVWIICSVLILLVILTWTFARIRLLIKGKEEYQSEPIGSKCKEEIKPMFIEEEQFKEDDACDIHIGGRQNLRTKDCKCCSLQHLIKKAVEVCFDCRQYFCAKCLSTFHNITEEMKRHITVNLDMVPEQFSPSIFNCTSSDHTNYYLDNWCDTHKKPVCNKCKSFEHLSCNIQMLSVISNDCVANYQAQFEIIKEQIQSFKQLLRNSVDSYKNKSAAIRREIKLAEQSMFQVKEKRQMIMKLSKLKTTQKLDEIEFDITKEATKLYDRSDDLLAFETKQKMVFEFVVKYGSKNHVIISNTSILSELIECLSVLRENVLSFRNLDINFEHTSGIIEFSAVHGQLQESHVSNESNYLGKIRDRERTKIDIEESINPTTYKCRRRKKSDDVINYRLSELSNKFSASHYI